MRGSVRLDDPQGRQEESLSIGLKGKLPGFFYASHCIWSVSVSDIGFRKKGTVN